MSRQDNKRKRNIANVGGYCSSAKKRRLEESKSDASALEPMDIERTQVKTPPKRPSVIIYNDLGYPITPDQFKASGTPGTADSITRELAGARFESPPSPSKVSVLFSRRRSANPIPASGEGESAQQQEMQPSFYRKLF